MSDSLGEIIGELRDHGFHNLEPQRPKQFIIKAAQQLQMAYLWQWRGRTLEDIGSGDLVADLGPVQYCVGPAGEAAMPSTAMEVREQYGSVIDAPPGGGTQALTYWREGKKLMVHEAVDVTVRYFSTAPWKDSLGVTYKARPTLASDIPAAPYEFRELILVGALKRAYVDANEPELAAVQAQEWQTRVDALKLEDSFEQVDEVRQVRMVDQIGG